jgi:hypothetical protein
MDYAAQVSQRLFVHALSRFVGQRWRFCPTYKLQSVRTKHQAKKNHSTLRLNGFLTVASGNAFFARLLSHFVWQRWRFCPTYIKLRQKKHENC